MTVWWTLAWHSAWNRRFVLSLTALAVALSTFVLLSIARLRADVQDSFAQAVSGTDLIVGARTSPIELLMYSVFRVGGVSRNIRESSLAPLASHRAVAWVVPLSLGDTHRGHPVVATTLAYFDHFKYGDGQPLVLAQGRRFGGPHEAVLGADVAKRLGYRLGDKLILSHGDGALAENDHADHPIVVSGILAATGTPVDRSVHISLDGMDQLHGHGRGHVPDRKRGPGDVLARGHEPGGDHDIHAATEHVAHEHKAHDHDHAEKDDHDGHEGHDDERTHAAQGHAQHNHDGHDHTRQNAPSEPVPGQARRITPNFAAALGAGGGAMGIAEALGQPPQRQITAALVGLKNRAAVFSVQREVAQFRGEPLMAILPAVVLDELWSVVNAGERALWLVSGLVAVVSLLGLMTTILAGLDARRRELAILRALGAGPVRIGGLLALEGTLVTLVGMGMGVAASLLGNRLAADAVRHLAGVNLHTGWLTEGQWPLLGAVLACGVLVCLVPAARAHRLALQDGLTPRN